MKKIVTFLIAFSIVAFNAVQASAQVIVRVRPVRPAVVVTRPPAPSPGAVWVEEEWVPQGDTYVWHGGYWTTPVRVGAVYVAGHWRHTHHGGYVWIPGHWR
ncbi:MAG TPA: hypothetical protein VGC22_12270 [Chitinophaga sp.]